MNNLCVIEGDVIEVAPQTTKTGLRIVVVVLNVPRDRQGKVTADQIPCTFFAKGAERVEQYVKVGDFLTVSGRIGGSKNEKGYWRLDIAGRNWNKRQDAKPQEESAF